MPKRFKIKMKTSMAGLTFSYQPGDVREVEERIAKAWQEAGISETIGPAEDQAPPLPPAPVTTQAAPAGVAPGNPGGNRFSIPARSSAPAEAKIQKDTSTPAKAGKGKGK